MQENRWLKIEEIFNGAIALPMAERQSFVKSQCRDDEELSREIILLVDSDGDENNFLNEPVFSLGAQLLENDHLELLRTGNFSFYKLQSLLGLGGMGAVFLAEDTRLERLVALKILPATIEENNETIKRYQNEAKSASRVAHPNIAHIYEFGSHNGRYFLAMEFVRGQTLREFIKENSVSLPKILDIILQIASALQAAHRNNIVHRDIKPENIIISEDGTAKVLDFGLAKINVAGNLENAESNQTKTVPELIMGTVSYMSPEQIRGETVNQTTDIWSLGVVFYEMLVGTRPFAGETTDDVVSAILNDEPPFPKNIIREKSIILRKIIVKMLQKNQSERYQTADELILDLQPFKTFPSKKIGLISNPPIEKNKKILIIVSLLAFFSIVGGLLIFGYKTRSSTAPINNQSVKSVAVLPFVINSDNADAEYLSAGLTETLINKLSQMPEISVKARNSVFFYQGKNIDAQTAGRELSVQTVFVGFVAEHGNNIRVDLEMIDSNTGNQVWGEQYNCNNGDLIALQNEMSRDVIKKLQTPLSGANENLLAKNYTQNVAAYQSYLKGRFYWNKRTGKDLQKSIEYFERAVALDPNYALAYAGLADSYVLLSGYAVSTPRESFPKAEESAKKALEIDDSIAEAHTALGYALFNYDWNFEASEKEMHRAVELNPNYSTAHHWYGNANLLAAGRFEESIAELERARELDPLSLIINADLATSYLYARQIDKAIEQYQKTIEMDENFYYAHTYLGRAYLAKNSFQQAVLELQKAQTLGDDPRILMLFARTYTAWNKKEEALNYLDKLTKMSEQRYVSPYYFALVYAGFNQNDEAFKWLEKALQEHEGRMSMIKVDPLLDNLRSDARFQDLVKRVGFEK